MSARFPRRAGAERGVAAIELAFCMSLFVLLIALVFMAGRLLYQYTVLKYAVHDAAVYIGSAPPVAMKTTSGVKVYTDRAEAIVRATAAASGIKPDATLTFVVLCDGFPCGLSTPAVITAEAGYNLDASLFGQFFSEWTDGHLQWRLQASADVPYAN